VRGHRKVNRHAILPRSRNLLITPKCYRERPLGVNRENRVSIDQK